MLKVGTMRRIKFNLDQLEEVRKQNEIAMNSTEGVIVKVRADLNSMTEEVWEGEDGDMAREQLDDLSYKQMPETWRQIDSCNIAIKNVQKKAYEAKNLVNGFTQIFKNGTMPSDSDATPCEGILMCDEESCESLKSAMEAAGQKAQNIYNDMSKVEDILSQLETDEAKFDYSSYIDPIKEQTSNVVDRTRLFCKAVSIYEEKVEDLDRAFSKELLASTPEFVPAPFDPSCLIHDECVHMNHGDIVDSLEEYTLVDLTNDISSVQIENILIILFGKKDINELSISEQDLEVALLKLPEDKLIALLMELGFSGGHIGAIVADFEKVKAGKKGGAVNNSVKRLKEIIEQLKKKAKESLKKEDNTDGQNESISEGSSNASSTPGEPIYQRGDEGEEIRAMQQWLLNNGYYTNGEVDGKYGGDTQLAVARFQRQHGLPITGYIDENTLQLLNESMNGSDPYQALVVDMDYINENFDLTEHQQDVLNKLYNDSTLALSQEQKNSMLVVAAELYELGMDDSFVVGVLANIASEGTAGEFEVRDTARKGEEPDDNKYKLEYKGGNIQAIGLKKTLELADEVGEAGIYGMGLMQWTEYSRKMALLEAYKTAMGYPDDGNPTQDQNYPTEEQCLRIEGTFQAKEIDGWTFSIKNSQTGKYVEYDLTDYWESQTLGKDSRTAAGLAAKYFCLYYENPKNAETKAEAREELAYDFYDVLIGD